jgi:hypothetical protein
MFYAGAVALEIPFQLRQCQIMRFKSEKSQ